MQINPEGLIPIAAGIVAWMAATGFYVPSKDPGKAEIWRLTYGPKLKIIAPIVVVFGLLQLVNFFGGKSTVPRHEPGVSRRVESICNEINKKAPFIIDSNTRFDGAGVGPGNKITFIYTLTNMEKSALTDQVKHQIKKDVRQNIANNVNYKIFRDEGVSVVFLYMFPDAEEALRFTISF